MIKSAIMLTALAATFVYATTDAFDTARATANNVADVYVAAGHINPLMLDVEARNAANAALFAKAEKLEKLAAYARTIEVKDEQSNSADIIMGFRKTL